MFSSVVFYETYNTTRIQFIPKWKYQIQQLWCIQRSEWQQYRRAPSDRGGDRWGDEMNIYRHRWVFYSVVSIIFTVGDRQVTYSNKQWPRLNARTSLPLPVADPYDLLISAATEFRLFWRFATKLSDQMCLFCLFLLGYHTSLINHIIRTLYYVK